MKLVVVFVLSTLMTIRTIHLAIKNNDDYSCIKDTDVSDDVNDENTGNDVKNPVQAGETGAVTIYSGAIWALV